MHYRLDEKGNPVPEPDPEEGQRWREGADTRVALEWVGDCEVSTVFLGEASGCDSGGPVLWETMILGGRFDDATVRCAGLRENALAMHKGVVERLRAVLEAG